MVRRPHPPVGAGAARAARPRGTARVRPGMPRRLPRAAVLGPGLRRVAHPGRCLLYAFDEPTCEEAMIRAVCDGYLTFDWRRPLATQSRTDHGPGGGQ